MLLLLYSDLKKNSSLSDDFERNCGNRHHIFLCSKNVGFFWGLVLEMILMVIVCFIYLSIYLYVKTGVVIHELSHRGKKHVRLCQKGSEITSNQWPTREVCKVTTS